MFYSAGYEGEVGGRERAGDQAYECRKGEVPSMGPDGLHVECFFFSSRRRHTRFDCDWSSDVCSSDLLAHELDMLPLVRKTESGVASRFADLQGLQDLPAPRHVEVLPYVVGRGHYDTPEDRKSVV